MKTFSSLLFAATLLTACSKKDADPQPTPAAPVQAATIDVRFDYYAAGSAPATTQSISLLADRPSWKQTADRLTLTLEKQNVLNKVEDHVDVVIPVSKLKTGLVGTYVLASQPNTSGGDALMTYLRPGSVDAYSNVYTSNANQLDGNLVITEYDAQRHLISGRYTVRFVNVKGPFSFLSINSAGDPRRDGDLTVNGTFQELPVK